jgi:hypothetical protein
MTALKICIKCGPKSISEFHKDSSRPDGLYPVCKACRKPLTTAQYASNQKEIRKRRKADYHANPEKYRAESKVYHNKRREQDPESLKAYHSAYYLTHKEQWKEYASNQDHEKVLANKRAYNEAHREQIRAGVRDWFRRHPHVTRLAANKRRAAWAKVEDTLTPEQLEETLEYFNYRCGYCLIDLRTLPKFFRTFDHLVAIKLGDSNTQDNVIPCCKYCNSRKKDRPVFVMAKFIKSEIPEVSQAA